jgi:FMN phosphatase YigB (HAD superfamily)
VDPAIYEIQPKRFQLTPQQILLLDDREENIAAARVLGFRTVLFKNVQQLRAELDSMGVVDSLTPIEFTL